MIEGSRSGSGSGSIPLTSGSGSGRPKFMWIRWIRIGSGTLVPVHPDLDLDSLNPVRDMDLGFWPDPDPDPVPGVHPESYKYVQ